MRDRRYGWAIVLGILLLQACTVDTDKGKLKARPVGCLKGTTLVCPCPDGSTSAQTCNELGRYDPCQCDSSDLAGTSG